MWSNMKLLYHIKCESSLELNKWSQRPWTLVPGPICLFSCCFLDSWFHCLCILFTPLKPRVIWSHWHITNAPYIFLLFSRSVVSNSLWPHGLQHASLPCPSPSSGACSNSCSLSWWCHSTIWSSVIPFSSCLKSFPASRVFSNELALRIRWPEHCNFSFSTSPSSDYSGLISFRMDWLDLLAVPGALRVFSNTTVQKHQFIGT